MYVCICNALTEKQIRTVVGQDGCTTAKVYVRLGCAPQCGKCVPYVREMVNEHRAAANAAESEVPLVAAE